MKPFFAAVTGIALFLLGGCAPTPEWSSEVAKSEAIDACRRMSDAGAARECVQRAQTLHAKRDTSGKKRD